ncbi:beta-galactosidase [Mangrovibacterium diazotrophicum]|uniref:Beta-galactosidase n=1 Tax=Mangrovibacterium diazotrophicum TaxID=1261403 RepID=A0A419W641_9BACT|nr:beta-galactosidase [Mangrovibacterium diazotrophicum]RKD90917.1 glycosyl hydrolase family 35 [Mangrovibacterium diazotrophicum]
MRYIFFSILLILIGYGTSGAQNLKRIDASKASSKVVSGQLKMGNPGPEGKTLEVNNHYLTLNGKPIIPVMGEVHYSRIPTEQWEDVLLKMKAGGVNIIAAYALWNHHEEIEGQFDWSGNKNIREFAKLCAKHDLYFYPRIGPWCHAEVRNGGTPDWILTKKNIKDRSNDPVYQHYADEWYKQVGLQLQGLMYKDGGPIIGVQLENEYRKGKGGEAHILWLKETAKKYGFDTPLYTVTGWQNGSVPPMEVIPLWAAYPDAPWADNLRRNEDKKDFLFKKYRDTDAVGDNVQKDREAYIDYDAYPYFTCEIGVGNMNTDHRRLQIGSRDGLALIMAKMGSGSNLPGYYMFAGGTNPLGQLTTLEENREESGYYNTNPVISYDFQAAINESGRLNSPYHEVKKLHYFLHEFGDRLAPMVPVFPEDNADFQYVVRSSGESAFVFGMNYFRHHDLEALKGVQFEVKLAGGTVTFPSKPVTISDGAIFMWPMNFALGNISLNYATAQPLCQVGDKWIFIEDAAASPEFSLKAAGLSSVTASTGKVKEKDGNYVVSGLKPGVDCEITMKGADGSTQKIIVLSKAEALNSWLLDLENGEKAIFVSDADLYANQGKVYAFDTNPNISVLKLNAEGDQNFEKYEYQLPEKKLQLEVEKVEPLKNATFLKTSAVDELDSKSILLHRFFLKEFSLNNPSEVKRAELLIYAETECKVQLNNRWVNQVVVPGQLTVLDVTGYTQKGENKLMLDFPFEAGDKAFAAELQVEHLNSNRVTFATNQAWLMRDSYIYPSFSTGFGGFSAPEQVDRLEISGTEQLANQHYEFSLPEGYADGLNNVYMQIDYTGDKGKLYFNQLLVADNFYSGDLWEIGLNRLHLSLDGQPLKLEISPLPINARVYFDDAAAKEAATNVSVKSVNLVPEYCVEVEF